MTRKYKILQVIDFLHVGGAERVCVTLSNLLFKASHEVAVLILVNDGELINSLVKNIPIIRLKRHYKYSFRNMYKCAKILRDYELIHVHMRHNYRYIQLIKRVFFLKTTVILHDHYGSIDIDKSIPFGLKLILKPTYYIGVSKTLLNWAANNLKLPSNSVFLLSNSVLKEPQSEIGIQKKGIVLVGNIKPIKNQLFAIRLMQHINNTLTIIGQIQDEKYYKELKQVIIDLKMEKKIIFVHNSTNIQHDIQQYEIGLQTATSESGPLVLIEYLAQSLPFLTFKTGQVVDDIKSDIPQLVLDNFEIEEWLKRLHEIQKMDSAILNNVYQKYFSEKMYLANCESIYKAITMNEISA